MRVIGLIPARGGSKRLPGKNLMEFHGKPLLWYSIQASLLSKGIFETYVSSDHPQTGEIASSFGAEFLKRPDAIASDFATTTDVLLHAVKELELNNGDFIVTLQPTNPFRPNGLLDDILSFALSSQKDWDSLTTVSPVKIKFGILDQGIFSPHNYHRGQRSQDMEEKFFYENGVAYITKVDTLRNKDDMFGNQVIGFRTEGDYSEIDIDTLPDFRFAESRYLELKEQYQLI